MTTTSAGRPRRPLHSPFAQSSRNLPWSPTTTHLRDPQMWHRSPSVKGSSTSTVRVTFAVPSEGPHAPAPAAGCSEASSGACGLFGGPSMTISFEFLDDLFLSGNLTFQLSDVSLRHIQEHFIHLVFYAVGITRARRSSQDQRSGKVTVRPDGPARPWHGRGWRHPTAWRDQHVLSAYGSLPCSLGNIPYLLPMSGKDLGHLTQFLGCRHDFITPRVTAAPCRCGLGRALIQRRMADHDQQESRIRRSVV